MKKRIEKGDKCLNCEHELSSENYCPNCGQLNNTLKPTFFQLISDALANLFAFDTKFYLSLWPLIRYPGRLSLEVVNGKRSTYLPPIRLFLLVVFITMAVYSISDRLGRSWSDIDHLNKEEQLLFDTSDGDTANETNKTEGANKLTFDDSETGDKFERIFLFVKINPTTTVDTGLNELQLEKTFLNEFYYSTFRKVALMTEDEFLNYVKSNLLLILLAFVPIVAFLLKALYFYKKQILYIDHFVFAIHVETAFFIFIIIQSLLENFNGFPSELLFLLFPVYQFIAQKTFYKQGYLATTLNFIVINIAFFVALVIFILLVGILSFILI